MSQPSDKALRHAEDAFNGPGGSVQVAVHAAHAPVLGLDRSVCLRDVLDRLTDCGHAATTQAGANTIHAARALIEREFADPGKER